MWAWTRTSRLFVLVRGDHPVVILDREGTYLGAWGEGKFVRPHGLHIGPDDTVYIVDDKGHAVHKFTASGEPLMSIDCGGNPSKTGYILNRQDTVLIGAGPFNRPTGVALAADGGTMSPTVTAMPAFTDSMTRVSSSTLGESPAVGQPSSKFRTTSSSTNMGPYMSPTA